MDHREGENTTRSVSQFQNYFLSELVLHYTTVIQTTDATSSGRSNHRLLIKSPNKLELYMRINAALLLFTCQLCFADSTSVPNAVGNWSEVTNGLRGRLLLGEDARSDRGMRRGIVYLELQNVAPGETTYVYYAPTKEPLRFELRDAEGKTVRNWISGSDGVPSPCWLALPLDSALRFRTGSSAYEPDEPGLFIIAAFMGGKWFIPAGATNDYYLSGTFTVAVPAGETRPTMWQGTLKLPHLKIPHENAGAPTNTTQGVLIRQQQRRP